MSHRTFSLAVLTVSLTVSGAYEPDGTRLNVNEKVEPRIINGQVVTIEQYPYLVAVQIWGSFQCGGSIISRRVVLTAAHCLEREKQPHKYSIIYGETDIQGATSNVIQVESFKMHPDYSNINMDYDVGLLFLAESIPFGKSAQCIKLAVNRPRLGSRASIVGWGETQAGVRGRLHAVYVYTIMRLRCLLLYKNKWRITPRMLCAGVPQGGKDACQGDSGGPLVVGGEQVGICSNGFGCGLRKYPGVYSNIAVLRNWIQSHVNTSCSDTKAVSASKWRTKPILFGSRNRRES
ncbi:trypsin alpha-3-like [Bactrocera neohumeralis]|uniref:trypsin alpha-3-like n=1 Tax=Bactrocera neohumeralis TaxID=98809 RepID=UPI002164F493|nr:trypsin alpha-3-like [Bactrocera neohumeralis]